MTASAVRRIVPRRSAEDAAVEDRDADVRCALRPVPGRWSLNLEEVPLVRDTRIVRDDRRPNLEIRLDVLDTRSRAIRGERRRGATRLHVGLNRRVEGQ